MYSHWSVVLYIVILFSGCWWPGIPKNIKFQWGSKLLLCVKVCKLLWVQTLFSMLKVKGGKGLFHFVTSFYCDTLREACRLHQQHILYSPSAFTHQCSNGYLVSNIREGFIKVGNSNEVIRMPVTQRVKRTSTYILFFSGQIGSRAVFPSTVSVLLIGQGSISDLRRPLCALVQG